MIDEGWRHRSMVARVCVAATVLAMGMFLVPARVHAADLSVPGDFPTIQAALDAAAPGDTVRVDPGVYPENLDFHGKDVRLESTGGPATTILHPPGGTGVTIGPAGAFVGFTVTGAAATFGAGMSVSGVGTLIQGDVFDGNNQFSGGFGAAIAGNVASPTIDRDVFRNNTCDSQFLAGVVSFVNGSSPRLTNSIFEHNPCSAITITLPTGTTPAVVNNTIVDNAIGVRVDARVETAAQVYRNNIVVGNGVGLQVDFGDPSRNPTWDHNLVFGNGTDYLGIADQTGAAGNLSADPAFVNRSQGDYHLQPGSPAIDAGSNVGAPLVDFDGNSRLADGNNDGIGLPDIGAFEAPGPIPPDTTPPTLQLPSDITVEAPDASGTTVSYTVSAVDDRDPAPVVTCQPASGSFFPVGTTIVQCQAKDSAGNVATGKFSVHVLALLQLGMTIASNGTVSSSTGVATISGTVTCSRAIAVDVSGTVRQPFANRVVISGTFSLHVACAPPSTPWSATASGDIGRFAPGPADVRTSASGCELSCHSASAAATVHLRSHR